MPDFTYEFYYQCSSVTYFRTEVGKYVVALSENGNRCECKGYQFSEEKTCKHVREAESKRCGWMQFVHGGSPVARGSLPVCPRCGAAVDSRKWAV